MNTITILRYPGNESVTYFLGDIEYWQIYSKDEIPYAWVPVIKGEPRFGTNDVAHFEEWIKYKNEHSL